MTLSSRQTGPRISASRCPTKNRALTVAVNAAGNLNRATADLELGRSPGLVAAFLFSLLVVALLLAALFDVVLFPFSALFVVALLLAALFVVALLLAALLLMALFFASCFGVWFFKVVPAVCHCDPPFISRSESTPAGRSRPPIAGQPGGNAHCLRSSFAWLSSPP
jgi:hypothetical protein